MSRGNQPAFPVVLPAFSHQEASGLTKREYFAAIAMQGMLANLVCYSVPFDSKGVAALATEQANDLLAELERAQ